MRRSTLFLLHLSAAFALAGCNGDPETGSPYAGEEAREIKALGESEVEGLLAGEGLGFAMAAELNGLPGPRHVLDAGDALALDPDQRARIQSVFDSMQAEAVRLGAALVEGERALDRLLASGSADPAAVTERVLAIALIRGELRDTHIQAHLDITPLLSADQLAKYREIRGYAGTGSGGSTTEPEDHQGHEGH